MKVTQDPRVARNLTILIASLILHFWHTQCTLSSRGNHSPITTSSHQGLFSDKIMRSCFTDARGRVYVRITIDPRTLKSVPNSSIWCTDTLENGRISIVTFNSDYFYNAKLGHLQPWARLNRINVRLPRSKISTTCVIGVLGKCKRIVMFPEDISTARKFLILAKLEIWYFKNRRIS